MLRTRVIRCCLSLLFVLSGVAGLGYEIVWTRSFAVGLGHEAPSMLAVVAAFFGGFALGAWFLDRRVSSSDDPGRWYAVLELVIAGWSLVSIPLIPWMNEQAAWLTGPEPTALRHWLVAFSVPLVVLLPATIAMGGTLPAMDRLFSRMRFGDRSVGGLYGANTFGAVLGTLAATFWLIPLFGHRATLLILAAVNVVCALSVLLIRRLSFQTAVVTDTPTALEGLGRSRIATTACAGGLLGVGYEVICVTVMGQVFENTVYSFASALSVYLVGTAIGAMLYQAFALWRWPRAVLSYLVQSIAAACLIGVMFLSVAPLIDKTIRGWSGSGTSGSIVAEFIVAALVFGLPTIGMGALFSHLAQLSRSDSGGVGRALAWNTLGACFAPPVFAILLMPLVGSKWTLVIIALGYMTLITELTPASLATGVALLTVTVFLPANLVHVTPPSGGSVLEVREGVHGTVAVVKGSGRHTLLKLNNRFSMGGTRSTFGEQRQAHIPLLLHPEPRRALFLGLGTGITFDAAADHPELQSDGVELVPEVVGMLGHFHVHEKPGRLRIITADARRYVKASREQYDVIIADLFHPARDGAGSLYTIEHFDAIRHRLEPGGIFCQWIPSYQMNPHTLRMIMRSFSQVFGEWSMFISHFNVRTPAIALIAGASPARDYDAKWFQARTDERGFSSSLRRAGIGSELDLMGSRIADAEHFARYVGDGPLNIDDCPRVTYAAPAFVYGQKVARHENLVQLLRASNDVINDANTPEPLRQFLRARDLYFQAEIGWDNGDRDEAIERLLESVGTSPQFSTAYSILMLRINAIAENDAGKAIGILEKLIRANPQLKDASRLLERLKRPMSR